MPSFVVERYRSKSDSDSLHAVADRLAAGARLAGREGSVRYVHTIFLPDDETCLHLFEADSESDVRDVARRAGIDIDRIVAAERVEPDQGDRSHHGHGIDDRRSSRRESRSD